MAITKHFADYIANLTDRNDHWTAAISIAHRYGTETEARMLEELEDRQTKRGYSEECEIACRTAITKAIIARLPGRDAAALKMGL